MVLKVKDGTRGTTSLCSTCYYSQIIKGSSESREIVYCPRINHWNGGRVPFRVVECNEWADKSKPSLNDMRESAWILSTDKKKHFGFQSPKEWRANRQEDGLDNIPEPPGGR